MKLALISDTHNQEVKNLPEGDILIHAGDWSLQGKEWELKAFCEQLVEYNKKFKYVIVISGNHDFIAESDPEGTKKAIEDTGTIYLNDSGCYIEGLNIWGSPIQPYYNHWAFNRDRGEEIQKHWDLIPSNTDILITHGPPYGILDKLADEFDVPGHRVGCKDLLNTIDARLSNLKLHLFGHIHEARGLYLRNAVLHANASMLNEHYKQVHEPIVIELE